MSDKKPVDGEDGVRYAAPSLGNMGEIWRTNEDPRSPRLSKKFTLPDLDIKYHLEVLPENQEVVATTPKAKNSFENQRIESGANATPATGQTKEKEQGCCVIS